MVVAVVVVASLPDYQGLFLFTSSSFSTELDAELPSRPVELKE